MTQIEALFVQARQLDGNERLEAFNMLMKRLVDKAGEMQEAEEGFGYLQFTYSQCFDMPEPPQPPGGDLTPQLGGAERWKTRILAKMIDLAAETRKTQPALGFNFYQWVWNCLGHWERNRAQIKRGQVLTGTLALAREQHTGNPTLAFRIYQWVCGRTEFVNDEKAWRHHIVSGSIDLAKANWRDPATALEVYAWAHGAAVFLAGQTELRSRIVAETIDLAENIAKEKRELSIAAYMQAHRQSKNLDPIYDNNIRIGLARHFGLTIAQIEAQRPIDSSDGKFPVVQS